MERISSPRKIITRSLPAAISIMPTVAKSSSEWNSPAGSPSHSTQIIETSTVSAVTTRKTSVKERRSGSRTTIPPHAEPGAEPSPPPHSQSVAAAEPTSPASASPPVTQRCVVRRVKASTSMTTTPTTVRISSGRRSAKLMSGATGLMAKLRFIFSSSLAAASPSNGGGRLIYLAADAAPGCVPLRERSASTRPRTICL